MVRPAFSAAISIITAVLAAAHLAASAAAEVHSAAAEQAENFNFENASIILRGGKYVRQF